MAVVASETHFERVVNLSRVLMVLTFVLTALVAHQYVALRDLRDVDCAAYAERVARAVLYDRLEQAWGTEPSLSESTRALVLQAYDEQRTEVLRAAAAGAPNCVEDVQ